MPLIPFLTHIYEESVSERSEGFLASAQQRMRRVYSSAVRGFVAADQAQCAIAEGRNFGSPSPHLLYHGTYLEIQNGFANFHLSRGRQLTRTCLEIGT